MQDQEFWHKKWAENKIGFHLQDVNPLLTQYWPQLNSARDHSVLVPLCGKSEDLVWLAEQHNNVTGVELSNIAVRAFFAEHFYTPLVTALNGHHELYQFDELTLYAGDFFTAPLTQFDRIYDRAALIAMPESLRQQYAERLKSLLAPQGKILLVSLDYDPSQMQGPPFSVPKEEVLALFEGFKVTHLFRDENIKKHTKLDDPSSYFAEEVWLIEAE
ncbi:MAG: thiopurine S-methyltransferase [Vibrio sp.]